MKSLYIRQCQDEVTEGAIEKGANLFLDGKTVGYHPAMLI